jgi:O-antigen/teichoic acid export membrane protein
MSKQSTLIKDILTLFTGNAIAFLAPVMLYPVLSRVFTPSDYAVFGLYSSIFAFLEIASAGRYDFAIVMPKQSDDGINLIAGGFLISVFYSVFILILVIFFNDFVALKLNNNDLAKWLAWLPLGLFFISISKLCNAWLIRAKKFKSASINKASQKIAEGSAQMVFGFLKAGNGLVLGDIAGRLFNALFSIYQSVKFGLDKSKVEFNSIRSNLRYYVEFPKFGILPAMLNALGGMMPVFIISMYYSVDESGNFNFSRILLSVPFALIATGISQVLMQQVSEKKNENEPILNEVYSLALKLFILSTIGTIIIYLFGPILFEFVFGAKWRVAGEYTSILILSTSISLVVSPFSILLLVLGKIKWVSYWQVFYFAFVSSLWLLKDVGISYFLTAIVAIDLVSYSLYGVIIIKAVRDYNNALAKTHV